MEILVGLVVLGGVTGLIFKWVRVQAKRDRDAIESLRTVIEAKQNEERTRAAD
jgi:hypothetical protein